MDLITYETIRAVHRAEKDEQLQKLPLNFFESVKNWISIKQKQSDPKSLLEIESAKTLLDEIISRREKKIMFAALRTIRGELPPHNLTDEERDLFERTVSNLKDFRQDMQSKVVSYDNVIEDKLEDVKNAMEEIKPREQSNGFRIRMLMDVPKFVGVDASYYGPYRIGETVSLKQEIADMLIDKRFAERVI